jgi:hypothetical protein
MKEHSPYPKDIREKMSVAQKKRMSDPKVRAKISKHMKKQWANPETREQLVARVGRKRKPHRTAEALRKAAMLTSNESVRRKLLEEAKQYDLPEAA